MNCDALCLDPHKARLQRKGEFHTNDEMMSHITEDGHVIDT